MAVMYPADALRNFTPISSGFGSLADAVPGVCDGAQMVHSDGGSQAPWADAEPAINGDAIAAIARSATRARSDGLSERSSGLSAKRRMQGSLICRRPRPHVQQVTPGP